MDTLKACLILAIILPIFSKSAAKLTVSNISLKEASATNENSTTLLLERIQQEQHFETLMLLRRNGADCFAPLELLHFQAKLILTTESSSYLKSRYNSEMLVVVCLKRYIDMALLEVLSDDLQHMRATRTLFLLKDIAEQQSAQLELLLARCLEAQMLNVLVVYENFAATQRYYSYTRFPAFNVEKYYKPLKYFPPRLQNLQQAALLSMPAQAEPGSIVYKDPQGRQRNLGYLFHLVSSFAHRLNATLIYKYAVDVGANIEPALLANLTANYELDLPICLAMPLDSHSLHELSDVVEITNWLPMLPRTGHIPKYQLYLRVLNSEALLLELLLLYMLSWLHSVFVRKLARSADKCPLRYLDIFLNDKVFRGLLGQSFKQLRHPNYQLYIVYFLLFLLGLIGSTLFGAYLNAFYSEPPAGWQLNSFADLKRSNTKIIIAATEYDLLHKFCSPHFMHSYADSFLIVPSLREFYALRKSLNPEFAYSIHSESWALVERQQQCFSQRLFRISENVHFRRYLLMAIPLAENSIYRAAFNSYLLEVKAFGFWQRWTSMSFYEMVQAGKLSYEDLSNSRAYSPLKVKDFYYIWISYGCALAICFAGFLAEIAHKIYWTTDMGQRVKRGLQIIFSIKRNTFKRPGKH